MHALYVVSVWLHLLAAMVWIGGMVFLAAVVVPALKSPELAPSRVALLHGTGVRFRRVGWLALGTLLVTGLLNLLLRGYGLTQLTSAALWRSSFGEVLAAKLVLVAVILALSLVHDFVVGPRATRVLRTDPTSPAAARVRRAASWLGRANLLLALAVLALAVMLVRGAPW
ncbi:MAG: CopD family protein [Thermodesulfobacteriota bacterium]